MKTIAVFCAWSSQKENCAVYNSLFSIMLDKSNEFFDACLVLIIEENEIMGMLKKIWYNVRKLSMIPCYQWYLVINVSLYTLRIVTVIKHCEVIDSPKYSYYIIFRIYISITVRDNLNSEKVRPKSISKQRCNLVIFISNFKFNWS